MALAHSVYIKGPEAPATPLDVKFFIFMDTAINLGEKNTPTYAP